MKGVSNSDLEKRIRALEDHKIEQNGHLRSLCRDMKELKNDFKDAKDYIGKQHDFVVKNYNELTPIRNFFNGAKWGIRILIGAILAALMKPILMGIKWLFEHA